MPERTHLIIPAKRRKCIGSVPEFTVIEQPRVEAEYGFAEVSVNSALCEDNVHSPIIFTYGTLYHAQLRIHRTTPKSPSLHDLCNSGGCVRRGDTLDVFGFAYRNNERVRVTLSFSTFAHCQGFSSLHAALFLASQL